MFPHLHVSVGHLGREAIACKPARENANLIDGASHFARPGLYFKCRCLILACACFQSQDYYAFIFLAPCRVCKPCCYVLSQPS